jgi:hypothetical protein
MNVYESDQKLIIEAQPAIKDTFLHLGVGIVFIGVGLLLIGAQLLVGGLFLAGGVLALVSFASQAQSTVKTYTFDPTTCQLHISNGGRIPINTVRATVHEDTWKGTYGEGHRDHAVKLSTAIGTFLLPANSVQEAHHIVGKIQRWVQLHGDG